MRLITIVCATAALAACANLGSDSSGDAAGLDQARAEFAPPLGATTYTLDSRRLLDQPGDENRSLAQSLGQLEARKLARFGLHLAQRAAVQISDKMDCDKPGKVAAKMLAALAQDETRDGQSIPPFRARPAFLDSLTIDATLDYMEIHLSPDQEARLAALAASVGRPADELVQEALAEWGQRQAERQPQRPKHTPAEAAARILELRKGNILPPSETIRNLINYGRA